MKTKRKLNAAQEAALKDPVVPFAFSGGAASKSLFKSLVKDAKELYHESIDPRVQRIAKDYHIILTGKKP